MTAIKQTLFKACPLHPDEPIIRASLDIKSPKLLYCQECMEGLDNSIQTGLFKFSHVGDKLYEQLSKKYAEYQHSLPSASPKEYQDKIESFITEQKARTDQEFVKIQTEVLELLTTSKNEVYKTLDKIKMNLLTDCEVSVEKVKNFPDPKIFEGKDITKDEIYKEIEGNEESVEDIEKKIRARLETMKQLDEIKEETTIGLSRHEKVKLLETLPLTNPKDPDFYKNSLKGLSPYIQALIFERDETKADEKSSIISSGQNNLLEVLTQSVQACQNSLEKTKDRVAGFVEGIVGLYYTDSIIDGKAVTESTNMNSNRNPYYDEPDNISSSSSEGKLYDDGYFDYEEEF